MIKEEAIEQRDSSIITDDPAINNNNNKESAFRIHIRKYTFEFILRIVTAPRSIVIIISFIQRGYKKIFYKVMVYTAVVHVPTLKYIIYRLGVYYTAHSYSIALN